MREKGQTEVAKTLETPVFSRGIEILTEKSKFQSQILSPVDPIPDERWYCPDCGNLNDSYELLQKLWKSPINE